MTINIPRKKWCLDWWFGKWKKKPVNADVYIFNLPILWGLSVVTLLSIYIFTFNYIAWAYINTNVIIFFYSTIYFSHSVIFLFVIPTSHATRFHLNEYHCNFHQVCLFERKNSLMFKFINRIQNWGFLFHIMMHWK